MKKSIIILTYVLFMIGGGQAQTYSATLSIGSVDISKLQPGDHFIIPVIMESKTGGLIAGFQFFIDFDHDLFSWKGNTENPLMGVQNFHKHMGYSSDDWLFNDNGSQFATSWMDNNHEGVDIYDGEVIFEIIFVYRGGMNSGDKSPLVWGDTTEVVEGRVVRGTTEMYSELLDYYDLTKMNGSIFN